MSFDFINTSLSNPILTGTVNILGGAVTASGFALTGSKIPGGAAYTRIAGTYAGVTGMMVATAVTTSLDGSTLNLGTKMFFVNGLLVSSSA